MASKVYYLSLSEDAYVNNSTKVADYLFSDFLLSDYSQTYLYLGHVSSLAWILQDTQGDMSRTTQSVQTTLVDYFTRYFNNVVCEVTEVPNQTDPSSAQISIYLKFTDTENKEFVLGKLIDVIDTKIAKIIDINNNG